jgi:hypothetical protein
MIARAERLPREHGQITVRGDSGFYSVELMMGLRKRRMRFTISATRTSVMWAKLGEIPDSAWVDATCMRGAQVAELPLTPQGLEARAAAADRSPRPGHRRGAGGG